MLADLKIDAIHDTEDWMGCSPHVTTGLWGLALLSLQGMLSLFFDEEPSLRTAHAYLGSGIMALFVIHAFLGLQLGLSI